MYSKNGICFFFFEKIAGAPLCHLLSWEKKQVHSSNWVFVSQLSIEHLLSMAPRHNGHMVERVRSGQDRVVDPCGRLEEARRRRRVFCRRDAERGAGVPVSSCIRRAAPAYKRLTSTSLHTAWTGTQPTVDRCVRCGYCLMASR